MVFFSPLIEVVDITFGIWMMAEMTMSKAEEIQLQISDLENEFVWESDESRYDEFRIIERLCELKIAQEFLKISEKL